MKLVSAEVIENEQVLWGLERRHGRNISGGWIIWLRCPEIAREAQPGQFVMVLCGDECTLPRPFSIHRVSDRGDIALLYAVWEDGKGTGWLSRRDKGGTVTLFGPLGNGFAVPPEARNLLLVAGGIGIAPLLFLAEQAKSRGCGVRLLRGASGEPKPSGEANPPQHYPEGLLPLGVEARTITTSPDGERGMVVDLLTPDVVGWADRVFACGPMPMYKTMAQMPELKNKPVLVSLEVRMGCGLGACYGCTVRTKGGLRQVCRDGPVFELGDILWDGRDG